VTRPKLNIDSKFFSSTAFWVAWFFVVLFIMNYRQARVTNFGCEICADKAGYYIYLPAVFGLGFQAENYADGLDAEHGQGFIIDRAQNKVLTKFTCGLAILQLPFYACGVLLARLFSLPVGPFSTYYLMFINIGAAFYIILGLYFLRKWLNFYFSEKTSLITVLIIFFGTNLYYYTIDETLMGHLYSFALFSIALFSFKSYSLQHKFKHFILFALAISFAILIRPTNILFVIIIIFLDVNIITDLREKLKSFILTRKPQHGTWNTEHGTRNMLTVFIILFLVLLPQLVYWKFAFGRYFYWSYQGEGFYHWADPKFLQVWFSPQGGLFPYSPLLLVSLSFAIWMAYHNKSNGILVLATFLLVSYLCASWSNPLFGECNFGMRPFVEYLPVLMLPFAYIVEDMKEFSKATRTIMISLIIFFIVYNLGLFVVFNTCFPGEVWDWNKFLSMLGKIILLDKF
jgi:hypothetical protein